MSHLLRKRCYPLGSLIQKNTPLFSKLNLPFSTESDVKSPVIPESIPGNHTKNDIGLFYLLPNSLSINGIFKNIFHEEYENECITFGETPFLIRKPALELIHYLKTADYNAPVIKYILYGKYGSGKSMTMYHLMHYAHSEKWLILHTQTMMKFLYAKRAEKVDSLTEKGHLDLPNVAAHWLMHFKYKNENVIKSLDLQLQNDHNWNIKEMNKKGESLMSIVDHGIIRTKYACDVVKALLSEIKLLSTGGKVKTLVCIDDYDLIFGSETKVRNLNHVLLTPEEISCVTEIKNLALSDWNNGAVVLTCFTSKDSNNLDDHLPFKRLGIKGFDFLIPFIPVEVPELTEKEIKSILTYYRAKKWLRTSEGDDELKCISGGNPLILRRLCSYV